VPAITRSGRARLHRQRRAGPRSSEEEERARNNAAREKEGDLIPRNLITHRCTEARKEGKSPSRYTTTRNMQIASRSAWI
jgi:hypothetical protein